MKLDEINRIAAMVDAGDRIGAIKEFRRLMGWGLLEAKNMVVGLDGKRTPDEFRLAAMREFISDPADLIAEFATHVRKLEQIIVQFAELADGFQPETPQPKPITVGCKVKVIHTAEWPEYAGMVGVVGAHDTRDVDLPWHVVFDDGEYIWFHDYDLEVAE